MRICICWGIEEYALMYIHRFIAIRLSGWSYVYYFENSKRYDLERDWKRVKRGSLIPDVIMTLPSTQRVEWGLQLFSWWKKTAGFTSLYFRHRCRPLKGYLCVSLLNLMQSTECIFLSAAYHISVYNHIRVILTLNWIKYIPATKHFCFRGGYFISLNMAILFHLMLRFAHKTELYVEKTTF